MSRKKKPAPSLMESVRRWFKKRSDGLKDVKITFSLFGNTITFPLNQSTFLVFIIFPIIGSLIWLAFYNKPCIYSDAAATDPEAIAWLIEQEPQAVVSEDMNLIKGIFAEDAKIVDYFNRSSPTIWSNPIDRYQPLFKDYQYIDAQNTNIKATGPISGDTVKYISGSHGTYTFKGQSYKFQNLDDASHWTATKIKGCWKITRFDFNASGVVFP